MMFFICFSMILYVLVCAYMIIFYDVCFFIFAYMIFYDLACSYDSLRCSSMTLYVVCS